MIDYCSYKEMQNQKKLERNVFGGKIRIAFVVGAVLFLDLIIFYLLFTR